MRSFIIISIVLLVGLSNAVLLSRTLRERLLYHHLGIRADQLEAISRLIIGLLLWFPLQLHWIQHTFNGLIVAGNDYGRALCVMLLSSLCLIMLSSNPTIIASCNWRSFNKTALHYVMSTYGILACLLIPLSLGLHFTRLSFNLEFWQLPLVFVEIFFATALIEELCFRVILQTSLETFLRPALVWLIASLLFGLSHLNLIAGGGGFPNWPYVALATIAGLGYGLVYMRTRSLIACTLLHTMVDFTWVAFLHK